MTNQNMFHPGLLCLCAACAHQRRIFEADMHEAFMHVYRNFTPGVAEREALRNEQRLERLRDACDA